MLSPHRVEGPYPDCADCPRVGSYDYLDAPTGRRRYGCDRHTRRRRFDPVQVAYALPRGTLHPDRSDRPGG